MIRYLILLAVILFFWDCIAEKRESFIGWMDDRQDSFEEWQDGRTSD